MILRRLDEPDRSALESFLAARPSTTMILRSNFAAEGFVDEGRALQGTYVGAFDGAGALVGVAGSFWNGNVVLEANEGQADLVRAASEASGRRVMGLLGEAGQVEAALGAVERSDFAFDSREVLYQLLLENLVMPPALERGDVEARCPRADEDDLLVEWRLDYIAEALGAHDRAQHEADSRDWIVRSRERRQSWVLESDGELVSYTAFNAAVADAVQVGGVWTPPQHRSRGFARAAVAASLLESRNRGVVTSFLFTDLDNVPAQRAYEALGFERVGHYRIVLRIED